jgi:hypothetical protein
MPLLIVMGARPSLRADEPSRKPRYPTPNDLTATAECPRCAKKCHERISICSSDGVSTDLEQEDIDQLKVLSVGG